MRWGIWALLVVSCGGEPSKPPVTQTPPVTATATATATPTATTSDSPPAVMQVSALMNYRGHNVYYLASETPCPKVAIGSRSAQSCLRLGLDDDKTSAIVDASKHTITITNTGTYSDETIIGDVVLPGWSESDAGHTPVGIHLVLRKKDNAIFTKLYSHVVVRDKPKSVAFENYDIVYSDGKSTETVLTHEKAEKAVLDPGISAKAAGFLFEMRDNLPDDAKDAKLAEKPVADITVAVGVGPAADKTLRAQLFKKGDDVELKFGTLSHLVPKYISQRDVFLYGVEAVPAVAEVKTRGLKKGETIDIAVKSGKGTVTFNGQTSDFPEAANSVHDFLQTAAVGMILARQAKLDGG